MNYFGGEKELENIVTERSMAGNTVPNYRNVSRNTLLIQPVVKHKAEQQKHKTNQTESGTPSLLNTLINHTQAANKK